jgi:hypothetical protein
MGPAVFSWPYSENESATTETFQNKLAALRKATMSSCVVSAPRARILAKSESESLKYATIDELEN